MFTGIVQAVGRVQSNHDGRLCLKARLPRLRIGASVAVNGVCLTVVRQGSGVLEFDLSPETLRLTNLGGLGAGDRVNLERSLRVGDGLDGHLVSGHVDAVSKILEIETLADGSRRFRAGLPKALESLVAVKSSITADGTSLTVTGVAHGWFETVLIPHTLRATTLGSRHPGDFVNLEADMLARYVRSVLSRRRIASKKR